MSNNSRYGVCYFAPLSFSTGAPFSATFTDTILGFSGAVVITGSYFLAASGTVDGVLYENFCDKLKQRLSAIVAVPGFYWARFDANAGRLYINNSGLDNWTIRFSGAQSARTFGVANNGALQTTSSFTDSDGTANTSAISGNFYPWGFWKSQYPERSDWRLDYEPEPFYFDHEADDGAVFSIGRIQSAVYSDWSHKLELATHVVQKLAGGLEPYSWQQFQADVRSTKPFLVFTASQSNVVSLGVTSSIGRYERVGKIRAEGSNFNPEYQDINQHRWRNLRMLTRTVPTGSFFGGV